MRSEKARVFGPCSDAQRETVGLGRGHSAGEGIQIPKFEVGHIDTPHRTRFSGGCVHLGVLNDGSPTAIASDICCIYCAGWGSMLDLGDIGL